MTRGFNTRSLHAGAEADPATGSRATPIHQTTSFVFDDAETAAEMSRSGRRATSTPGSPTRP